MAQECDKALGAIIEDARQDLDGEAMIDLIRKISKEDGFEVIITAYCVSEFATDALHKLTVFQLHMVCLQVLAMKNLTCKNLDRESPPNPGPY